MAGSFNKVVIGGRLGADPDIKTLSADQRVGRLSIATTDTWRNADGEQAKSTQWHTESQRGRFCRAQPEKGRPRHRRWPT